MSNTIINNVSYNWHLVPGDTGDELPAVHSPMWKVVSGGGPTRRHKPHLGEVAVAYLPLKHEEDQSPTASEWPTRAPSPMPEGDEQSRECHEEYALPLTAVQKCQSRVAEYRASINTITDHHVADVMLQHATANLVSRHYDIDKACEMYLSCKGMVILSLYQRTAILL